MVTDQAHLALLGPNVGPMPHTAFVEALRLRAEEERTRQEQIRLQLATKNLQLAELAVKNDVPAHLIPSMCVGSQPLPASVPQSRRSDLDAKSPYLAPSPSIRSYDPCDNASSVAPLNYRFGGGSKPPNTVRRPLSPAKLGAAAVANLANPVTPYRPSHRTLPKHQRHFSMPAETLSPVKTTSERKRQGQPSNLQSPLGSTSSLQVRPLPAQPLRKHTKSQQVPTQESMSSFQHVIQFHHWRPENLAMDRPDHERGERTSVSSTSLRRGLVSHKRHKSNEMSIDLLLVPQEAYLGPLQPTEPVKRATGPGRAGEKPEDVSMDEATITEKQYEPAPLSRFPHDILLENN